ncbi:MAG: insulinase family protein [Kofleriaceae bacterium]
MMKRAVLFALSVVLGCGGSKPTPTTTPDPSNPGGPAAPTKPVEPLGSPTDQALALWPEVKRGVLPNGLTYYVMKNKKPEKRALLWLAVNSGSVQEDDDQRGLAHFVEHMAFNGTKRFPKADIINYIEKIGMRFGADLNAYTSWDETVYQLEVPTDGAEFVDTGFDILRDWSGDITFDAGEVDKERGVVLEEWRLGRGAGRRLFDKHVKVMFKGSRYAERITIGLPEILKTAPRDTLVRYYKDFYRPDNMAVIAVGDFSDPAAIEKQIMAKFGDLKNPAKPRPRPRGEVPKADGTRISIETDKEQTSQSVSIQNQFAHRAESTVKDFRRSILEQVYDQIFNERLRVLARKKDTAFTSGGVSISNNTREIDSFTRSATVKGGRVEDVLRALFSEVLRIEQHGFTQGELERARINIARQAEQAVVDAPTAQSRNHVSEIVRNFLEHEFMIGRTAERDIVIKLLPDITLAELNQLAKQYGGADNRVIVISGPDDKPLPARDRILAIVDEVGKSKVEPWVEKAPPAALMATAPKPGTITKETKIDKIGVTEWTLSNGARVIVKPTDFEADSIQLSGTSPGGLAQASNAEYPNARFADTIAGIGGVAELDVEDISKLLAGKQAAASTSINEITESVSGRASAKDIETMFQLLYLRMTAPRKDEDAIAVWRANFIEQLQNREKSPDFQFSIKSNEVLWQGNPRRKLALPADIAKVDADKALAFYKGRFGDATDFTFVIVGTVDLAKLRPLVETYLASLPSKGRREKEKDLNIRRVGGVVKKSWAFGVEPKARVSILFHGDQRWTRDDDRDMYTLNRVAGIRLREVMREDMGGVYGVGASGTLLRSPHQERLFTVSFSADPTRVDELIAAAQKEIAAIAKSGVDEKYLDKVRKGFERDREVQLKSNGFWLGWLESSARFNDDPTLVLDSAPMLARMTSANVQAAAKRFIATNRIYQSVMMPASDKAPPVPKKPPPSKDPKIIPGAEKSN